MRPELRGGNFGGVENDACLLQTFFHAQDGRVFAEQGCGVGHGQVNEFLIVRVFAGVGRFGGGFCHPMVSVSYTHLTLPTICSV